MPPGCRSSHSWSAMTMSSGARSTIPYAWLSPRGSVVNRYVLARPVTRSYSGSHTAGLPMGARLRPEDATGTRPNRDRFSSPEPRPSSRRYGPTAGSSPIWPAAACGSAVANDHRWEALDQLALRSIPATAFEVLDTIHSKVSFIGPQAGSVGNRSNLHDRPRCSGRLSLCDKTFYFLQSVRRRKKLGRGGGWDPKGRPQSTTRIEVLSGQPSFQRRLESYLLKAKPYLDWVEASDDRVHKHILDNDHCMLAPPWAQ